MEPSAFLDTAEADVYGRNMLHSACVEGSVTLANALLRLGANIDCPDRRGATPLMLAVAHAELNDAEQGERRGEIVHPNTVTS